ncbi:AMP nucleosidase [Candidatus Hydrogenosomobacter endosymbioticus]|uniref:AMP nucleosidase n=2 Tax=Candidatus Hydrogenosomobacter endosymbioticus TaxID=2558174 RepID=A0ABM7V9U2_9PROT|nr:AMP nucleosidase [Candidatus Hydrogenosomobacter endosymbioticus]
MEEQLKNISVLQSAFSHSDSDESIVSSFIQHAKLKEAKVCHSVDQAFHMLRESYDACLFHASQHARTSGIDFCMTYPYLGLTIHKHRIAAPGIGIAPGSSGRSVHESGMYGTTITKPDLFEAIYRGKFEEILSNKRCTIIVGISSRPIYLPFLNEKPFLDAKFSENCLYELPYVFKLSDINDDIANGLGEQETAVKPLSLFAADRVDYSMGRIAHYCGIDAEHFQKYILFTNYSHCSDIFFEYAKESLQNGSEYSEWVDPDNSFNASSIKNSERKTEVADSVQMPAYHLKRKDGHGISVINIRVGASNAKTITDHLAVLRPECWVMLGHCAGILHDQHLGDYVLASGYVRKDFVLDSDVPLDAPIAMIPEVHSALLGAIKEVSGYDDNDMSSKVKTGSVMSTVNRNWELRAGEFHEIFRRSRVVAVDMESATIAANGFRFRIPYGVLLSVSDKPLHGELRMKEMAKMVYKQWTEQHLRIGINAMEKLRRKKFSTEGSYSRSFLEVGAPPLW